MAKSLGPKSRLLRKAITIHSHKRNAELAEMLNDADERMDDKIKVTAEARQARIGLLGPAPEHRLAEFIRHGPVDVMGDEAAMQRQERFRKAEAQEAPKKPLRTGKPKS